MIGLKNKQHTWTAQTQAKCRSVGNQNLEQVQWVGSDQRAEFKIREKIEEEYISLHIQMLQPYWLVDHDKKCGIRWFFCGFSPAPFMPITSI